MSYTCLLTHIVFSTKERRAFLQNDQLRRDSHAYLGGIVRNLDSHAYAVGGVADHVHLLVSSPPTLAHRGCGSGDQDEFLEMAA